MAAALLARLPLSPARCKYVLALILQARNWSHQSKPKDVSHKTMAERRRFCLWLFDFLRQQSPGYRLDPQSLSGRHVAVLTAYWLAEARAGRPLAIFGPRQIGKTHFLTRDLHEATQATGWEPVYVDLSGQSDPLAAVNTAVGEVLRRLASATGRTAVTSVGALGISVGMAAPAPLAAGADPTAVLASQFAELVRLQPSKPVLLMLDEAQTLAKTSAGDLAMKAIRALFNSHPGSVLLVFTGSSKPQLMSLVADHSKMALEQLLPRPGEMIDLVRFMITATLGAAVPTALEAFKAKIRRDLGFQQQFDARSPLQQASVLEAAAATSCSRRTRATAWASARPTPALPRRPPSTTGWPSWKPRAA